VNPGESFAAVWIALVAGALLFPVFRGLGRRLEGKERRGAADVPPETMKRLERMEHAIEAVAVEVERISEGQRFVTKVLAERERDALRLPAEPR
jgi:hypothetical protein